MARGGARAPSRSPRRRDYKAEYARRVASGRARGKTRQEARGHAPPAGFTESQARLRRETTKVLREGGTTSAERQRIKRWVLRMAAGTDRRARELGRADSYITPDQAVILWRRFLLQWGNKSFADFERLRDKLEDVRGLSYNEIFRRYGEGGARDAAATTEGNLDEDIDEEFGLMLADSLLWFVLWRSGRPPAAGEEREAA